MSTDCPLCKISDKTDIIFAEIGPFRVVQTKDLKGHKNRIMIVANAHVSEIDSKLEEFAVSFLDAYIRMRFGKDTKPDVPWGIMEPKFASIKDHWHIVASDFDGDDIKQMLETPLRRLVI